MKILAALFFCSAPLQAQIYADIAVTQGETDLGTIRIRLEHEKTPRTVANFIGLATGQYPWIDPATGQVQRNTPYYDGIIFHRLIHNFVIQGGDPTGTGQSGPGYVYQDEFDPTLRHNGRYLLSMANSGVITNGSQFFITLAPATNLDDKHSIFGEVIADATFPDSKTLVDSFTNTATFPTGSGDRPITNMVMESVTISGPDLAGFDLFDPALRIPLFEEVKNVHMDYVKGENGADDVFNLLWDAKVARNYPIYYSNDLTALSSVGSIFSMIDETASATNITDLATEMQGFSLIPTAINYSMFPKAPTSAEITATGAQLELTWSDGTLLLTFDGEGSATWSFNDGASTGGLTSLSNSQSQPYFSPADDEKYYSAGTTLARARSLRQLTAFLDGSIGTPQITAIQPALSFHENLSGYFDGVVNSTFGAVFRGNFTFTPAP
ncbi:peptidylprolyl isomerase [Akkermansiaceae bacterium]|nr:peptidylprolyl isomerase [Akkermansiaceae bacterium]MDB4508315.1 peptidylprolyl isomerase [Akkermansiaceae bacterium]